MNFDPTTKKVIADKRKGLVKVYYVHILINLLKFIN